MPGVPEIAARVPCRLLRLGLTVLVGRLRGDLIGPGRAGGESIAKHLPSPGAWIPFKGRVRPCHAPVAADLDARYRCVPREGDPDDLLRSHLGLVSIPGAPDDRFD